MEDIYIDSKAMWWVLEQSKRANASVNKVYHREFR